MRVLALLLLLLLPSTSYAQTRSVINGTLYEAKFISDPVGIYIMVAKQNADGSWTNVANSDPEYGEDTVRAGIASAGSVSAYIDQRLPLLNKRLKDLLSPTQSGSLTDQLNSALANLFQIQGVNGVPQVGRR